MSREMSREQTQLDRIRETRRRFLATVAIAGSALAAGQMMLAQAPIPGDGPPRGMPTPPPAAEPKDQGDASPVSNASAAKRAQMLQQEKEFREGIERLYALSGELHDEVQKTPTLQVLSVHMYKKTEEIEKLAKQLKSKAKGG
jgi:hypothetical protein